MASPEELAAILVLAQREPSRRKELFKEFIRRFNHEPLACARTEVLDELDSITMGLALYEPNPEWAKEDRSFYGDEAVDKVFRESLDSLRRIGVAVVDDHS